MIFFWVCILYITLYPRDEASWTDLRRRSVPSPDLLFPLSVVTILMSNIMSVSTCVKLTFQSFEWVGN